MSEKPILFSTPMVQAILDGHKTQTRRVIKLPDGMGGRPVGEPGNKQTPLGLIYPGGIMRPRYQLGDILWVRETWNFVPTAGHLSEPFAKYVYRADKRLVDNIPWRPSIHMPREAARIFLRVTNVRAERVQEISYDNGDIWAEGIPATHDRDAEINNFMNLWDGINAKRGHGWGANPWVWVYEFVRYAN